MKMKKSCFITILTTMANQCYGLRGARMVKYYNIEKDLKFNNEPLRDLPFENGCKWTGPVR